MSSSSASRSPSLIACATRLDKILFSCADIRLLLPDPLAPTDYKHTVHDATRRCPVHLDAIPQSRGSRGGGRSYRLLVGRRKLGQRLVIRCIRSVARRAGEYVPPPRRDRRDPPSA